MALTCHGEVSGREVIAAQSLAASDPERLRRWTFAVLDQTQVTLAKYTPDDVHTAAAQDRHFATLTRPGFLVALIATTDYQFGICRMWQLLTDDLPWRTCVFRDPRLAESWLRDEVRERFQLELPSTLS